MIRLRERLSYAAGDLGFNFVWQTIELYLLFYYVRGLGLSPGTASAIFLAGAAMDWISDPLIGALADRLAPNVPLRAWVAVGGPLAGLMLVLTFTPPQVSGWWTAAFALVTHLALRLAYSLGNIPYSALTARISADPADHLALTGVRMQGAAIGGLIAALVYALLPAREGAGSDFHAGAILLAVLALPAFLATAVGVRERIVSRPEPPQRSFVGNFATMATLLAKSDALRRLLVTILAAGLAVTVTNKSLLFLFDEIGAQRLGYYIALVPALSLLLSAPLWTRLACHIGRPRTLVIAAALQAVAVLLALFIGGVEPVLVLVTISIVAGSGMSIMFLSLIPVVVGECEREAQAAGYAGRIFALSSIARKLAQAIAPQIVALTLLTGDISVLWGLAATALAALAVVLVYRPSDEVRNTSG